MTKLEELKAAFEAATPGEWDFVIADNAEFPHSIVVDADGEELLKHRYGVTIKAQNDVSFVHIAHNLMPQLLEAVELLEEMTELARVATATDVCDDIKEHDEERIAVAQAFLEKLT